MDSWKEFFSTGTNWKDLADVILQPAFGEQMKDVIEYRAMDYYRRRYEEKR